MLTEPQKWLDIFWSARYDFKQPYMPTTTTTTTTTTTNIVFVVLYVKMAKQCQTDTRFV
jgi:hypothetical protein